MQTATYHWPQIPEKHIKRGRQLITKIKKNEMEGQTKRQTDKNKQTEK